MDTMRDVAGAVVFWLVVLAALVRRAVRLHRNGTAGRSASATAQLGR